MTLNRWVLPMFLVTAALQAAAKPVVLSHDDGKQDDRRSIGGDGEAVRFERPAGAFFLTAVQVFGSRYGGRYDPSIEVAKVSICDASLQPIASGDVALEKFPVGQPVWVEVPVAPVQPPETFFVLVDFFATQTKGVYLGIDKDSRGHSITGLPGKPGDALADGDWMVRAVGTASAKEVLVLDPSSKKVLSYGDGEPDDKRSTAGSGHAVQFAAPAGEWYVGEVSIHGSPYGGGFDPGRTLFHVFVCDNRMKVLSRSAHSYSLFPSGEAGWVTVPTLPVRVAGPFYVLVYFDPTQTRGIFLSIDKVKSSHSIAAMPNKPMGALGPDKEWMIRASLMKRGKGSPAAPPRESAGGGVDALGLAKMRSSLDELEKKEDLEGMAKVLADAKKSSGDAARALGAIHSTEHVLVRYVNVPEEYARAAAALFEVCDASLRKRFGVETGICTVKGKRLHLHFLAEEGKELSLWTAPESADFPLIVNTMPSWKRGLSPPAKGGPHIVYGLCHELGHVLMGWEDCRHQWAHYLGSLLVEDVAKDLGAKAWPQSYDIRAEGLKRFMKEIEGAEPDRATESGTARIFFDVGERFGLDVWGKALVWIRKNRGGKPFHATRLYRLDDLRDALLDLGRDPKEVGRILGGGQSEAPGGSGEKS